MKLVQITDLHITPPGATLGGINTSERLTRLVDHINQEHRDADLVIATGDLTDEGDAQSYERLATLLEPLTPPLALLIGNHDIRENFQAAFPQTPKDADGHTQYVIEIDGNRLIMMDTMRANTHAGHYDAPRLHWLDQTLSRSEQPCLLFMHHPPMPVGMAGVDLIGQRDHRQLAEVLKRHKGKIRYMIFGHCHMQITGSYLGVPVSGIRSSCNRQGWPDFNEQHTLNACNLPPAYAVMLVNDHSVLHHTIDYTYDDTIQRGLSPEFGQYPKSLAVA